MRGLTKSIGGQKNATVQRGWGRIETIILSFSVAGLAWLFLWPAEPFGQVSIGMSRTDAILTGRTQPSGEGKALPFCREGAAPLPGLRGHK